MTAPAPPLDEFAVLDRLIIEAFTDLRSARASAARTGNRANLDLLTRAEEHLNALLEYRHAVVHRASPTAVDGAAGPPGRRDRPR
ncbi:hypothetical protein ACI8AC_23870 [Geodermatophilus sp. SYSU D00758]